MDGLTIATYLMLLNWTDQGIRTVKESPKRLFKAYSEDEYRKIIGGLN